MAYDYKKLTKQGGNNAPGLKKKVLVAPVRTFTSIAVPTAAGATPGDSVDITGDHTFGPSDGFIELYTTMDTSELTGELVGERDSNSTNPKVVANHPGLYKEALEFAKNAKDEDWIVLVEGLDGAYIQIGTEELGADANYRFGSGKVSGGYKGITLNFESFGEVFIYEGTITLKPVA
ncbi:MAG: hypothetical protein AAGF85_00625 [Bacteroidota bacterium]